MRCWSKWSGPLRGSVFIVALGLCLPASAQGADAGPAPAEPAEPEAEGTAAAGAPSSSGAAESGGAAGSGAAEPAPPPGLKALAPSQRLPENLQGWMRERQRRNPALVERRPLSDTPPSARPQLTHEETNVEGLKRRLRSFNEGGVTVLSNRRDAVGPVAPEVTRVAAAAAVPRPAPAPEPSAQPVEDDAEPEEDDEDDAPVVETRSLRPQPASKPASAPAESSVQWPAWLAVCAGLGLVVVWLRKRRAIS